MRYIVALVFVSLSTLAQAQQVQGPKDRKDFLLEALESQRNDGLAKLALCYADANEQIGKLSAQVQALNAELAKRPPTATSGTTPPP